MGGQLSEGLEEDGLTWVTCCDVKLCRQQRGWITNISGLSYAYSISTVLPRSQNAGPHRGIRAALEHDAEGTRSTRIVHQVSESSQAAVPQVLRLCCFQQKLLPLSSSGLLQPAYIRNIDASRCSVQSWTRFRPTTACRYAAPGIRISWNNKGQNSRFKARTVVQSASSKRMLSPCIHRFAVQHQTEKLGLVASLRLE